jgi:hypothetical protein
MEFDIAFRKYFFFELHSLLVSVIAYTISRICNKKFVFYSF